MVFGITRHCGGAELFRRLGGAQIQGEVQRLAERLGQALGGGGSRYPQLGTLPAHCLCKSTGQGEEVRMSAPKEPWLRLPKSLITSISWERLPPPSHMFLRLIEREHLKHGGAENGRLIITYDQCIESG